MHVSTGVCNLAGSESVVQQVRLLDQTNTWNAFTPSHAAESGGWV
jgi:hypothetical protein